VLEVRRGGWARWFEGWLLKDPPPAAPIAEASWLAVRPADSQTDVIRFSIVPVPGAFPSGVGRLQTAVSVRNTGSGVVTEPQAVTLRRAPGKPQVQAPAPVAFKGIQGGPIEPRQIALRLSALGLGFRWSTEGAVPGWIELTPSQGDLGDNASVEIIAKPRPTASTLAPGKYEGQVIFRSAQSGNLAEQVVQLVVEPRPPPPPGRLVVEPPSPLQFSGPQGGPFMPKSVPLTVKAVGTGFKWAAEGVPQWLELTPAQGELRDNTSANIVAAPRQSAQAMKPGTYEGQFIFRKVGSGDTVAQTAQLVVGPPVGQLKIDGAPVVFAGPQGGPFAPARATLQLKAVGNGFEWSAEAASFVQVSPAQGRLGDNESVEIEVKPAPAAQALTPGSYSAGLTFKKKESGEPTVHPVRLVVRLSF
jgi:hypothetical protein